MVKYHVRKDKLAQLSFRRRSSLAYAIVDVAADRQTSKEQVIIEALVAYTKRKGLWPPNTLEEEQYQWERQLPERKRKRPARARTQQTPGSAAGSRAV